MKRRRGGRGAKPQRHVRAPRPHPVERDPNPGPGMPPGTVMLVCPVTGDVLSDVLEADWEEGWWPSGHRYAYGITDSVCREGGNHTHEVPTQDEIAARVAEAKQYRTVIQHRVNVKRYDPT
jgi:hypothetical protein